MSNPPVPLPARVITCSDSAAAGTAQDLSGPLAAELLAGLGHDVGPVLVTADEIDSISESVRAACSDGARIVVVTGGTGAGPRDVTPEALRALGLRELPGMGEVIRAAARERVPATDLSRCLGGVIGSTVVVALPGSPGGVRDGLAAVGGLLAHAAGIAGGGGHATPRGTPSAGAPDPAGPAGLVRAAPISEAEVADAVRTPAAGAIVTFAGIVRDHDRGRAVTGLFYEAHPTADVVMAEVLAEAHDRPGVLGAAARHRVGDLEVGELAFAAAIAAAHRSAAFDSCSWLVDQVKARLPVWKHQRFADGTDEWVNCA